MTTENLKGSSYGDRGVPFLVSGTCLMLSVSGCLVFLPGFHLGLHGPCGMGSVFTSTVDSVCNLVRDGLN
jgi:hypothetical protein